MEATHAAHLHDVHEAHHEHEMGFWQKYVFSTDHKVIGIQYGVTALFFLLFGFGLMMLIGVAGDSMNAGVGVGGFFVIMGLAFFINGYFDHPLEELQAMPPRANGGSGPITPEPPRGN